MAMPVLHSERPPDAVNTYTTRRDAAGHKALQAGTSHFLRELRPGHMTQLWEPRWRARVRLEHVVGGVPTRLICGLIMTHGNDDVVRRHGRRRNRWWSCRSTGRRTAQRGAARPRGPEAQARAAAFIRQSLRVTMDDPRPARREERHDGRSRTFESQFSSLINIA